MELTILKWMWTAFGLYWLAAAAKKTKSATHEVGSLRILRIGILVLTFILLLTDWLRWGQLGWRFVPDYGFIRWPGVALTTAGMVLCVWARVHLGAYWSDKVELKVDHQLIQSGPYEYLRHPIYSGVLLGVAGTALAVGEWRGVVALIVIGTNYVVKARREERILASQFGERFVDYRKRTGFLAPHWPESQEAEVKLQK